MMLQLLGLHTNQRKNVYNTHTGTYVCTYVVVLCEHLPANSWSISINLELNICSSLQNVPYVTAWRKWWHAKTILNVHAYIKHTYVPTNTFNRLAMHLDWRKYFSLSFIMTDCELVREVKGIAENLVFGFISRTACTISASLSAYVHIINYRI